MVSNGKGGDDARIPKDMQSSLLGRGDGLCSAVVNKGGDLICFLNDAQGSQTKWPSLLGRGSF